MRRIEAVTGRNVLEQLTQNISALAETARLLKVMNPVELPQRAKQVMAELKEKDRQIESLNAKIASMNLEGVFRDAQDVDGVKVVFALLSGTGPDALRALCDKAKEAPEPVAAVFAGISGGKATLVAACNKPAQEKGLKAGLLVKSVAQMTGGNGGGKPDFAMAGAKDHTKLDEALAAVPGLVREQMQ